MTSFLALTIATGLVLLLAHPFASQAGGQPPPPTEHWAAVADISWWNTTDTEFTLTTPEQLAGLAQLVNTATAVNGQNMTGQTINLGSGIDLRARIWTPIGTDRSATNHRQFRGHFNGNHHEIILSTTVQANSTAANLAVASLFGAMNNAVIENFSTHGNVNSVIWPSSATGWNLFSSAIGETINTTVRNVVNKANLTMASVSTSVLVGGVHTGGALGTTTLINVANYGNITYTRMGGAGVRANLGGITGRSSTANTGMNIINSYNRGNITLNGVSSVYSTVAGIYSAWGAATGTVVLNIQNAYNFGLLVNTTSISVHEILGDSSAGARTANLVNTFGRTNNFIGLTTGTRNISHSAVIADNGLISGLVTSLPASAPANRHTVGDSLLDAMNIGRNNLPVAHRPNAERWTPNLAPYAHLPTFGVTGNVEFNFDSTLFDLEFTSPSRFRQNFTVGSHAVNGIWAGAFDNMPSGLALETTGSGVLDEIDFIGWATSQTNANNGTVAFGTGTDINVLASHVMQNPLRLFAVYQFNPRRTLTVVQADGILATGANFQRVFYRPNQFITAGTTNQLPLAFGRLDPTGVEVPNATHIGWATSLQNSRNGIIEWPIATNFATQPNLFVNTTIYAVWQRNTDARVEFRRSHFHPEMSEGNFPSIDFVNDTRFDLEYIEFDTAQTHPPINLAQFNPGHITHTGTPGFAFVGWATTPNGAPVHSSTATVTFNGSTALYAIWEPIRLTVFFSSVYNTGITSLIFDLETVGATVDLTAISPPGYDNAPNNIAIGNFQTNGETFEFLGFANTLANAQNGNANIGLPTNFTVTRSMTLHATWNALGMGVALPPIEGENPQDLPPNPSLDALSQPTNITFNESTGVLSWEWTQGAHGAAHGFRVYINGTPHTFVPGTLTRSANVGDLISDTGTYQIRVRTIGNNVTNTHSDVSTMYVEIAPATTQLLAPTNVVVGNNGVVTWNNPNLISNGYRVYIFDNTGAQVGTNHTSSTTSFDLETLTLAEGKYTVRIIAVGGGLFTDSPQSAATNFWVDQQGNIHYQDPDQTGPIQLNVPQNVRVVHDNGQYVLKWDAVTNSHYYRIYINGNAWYTTTNISQIAVILYNFPHGDFAIQIRALAPTGNQFLNSEQSTTLTIRVQYDYDGYDEIIIVCSSDPSITTPPPPGMTPPNTTMPYPPTLETDSPTFIDWLRNNWWWLLICLVVLILAIAFAIAIARRRGRDTLLISSRSGTPVDVNCTLKADAEAAIAEARKKLQSAIEIVVQHDAQPQNAALEQTARATVMSADQALDRTVSAVAKYKNSKTGGGK